MTTSEKIYTFLDTLWESGVFSDPEDLKSSVSAVLDYWDKPMTKEEIAAYEESMWRVQEYRDSVAKNPRLACDAPALERLKVFRDVTGFGLKQCVEILKDKHNFDLDAALKEVGK